ncbi:gram positive anchor [Streptococcus urinalis 2285-97]|uniref:Gram positive anchor n=1 Tax=Streptococcus urinalis 2285-97 TaxID=764291 RepID=G5KDY8_9STRE|nr:YSIRK signal domain/LPXTG anchor domain surface protein [Streptococcus urinalis]EHJ56026.1 gram positive anchor [Streptococcus urinalis 2285-97]
MLRKYKQSNYDVAHTKQRFSIKKFKFGAASVLVGLAFLGMAGTTVLADETTSTGIEPKQSASAGIVDEVKPAKSELATDAIASVDKTTESKVEALADYTENVNTDVGGTVPESSANIDPNSSSKDTDKVAVLEETASEKNVIVSPAITTLSVDSAVEKANVDKNSVSEVSEELQKRVQKDAIYSPGDSSAKQTYSGKAWIDNGGSIEGQDSDDIPLAGVKVYLQWVNGKGYVSKVYYTTTLADGTFAFDLSKSEVDPNGEEHRFQLAGDGNFAVRTWIENPDSSKYDIIQAGDKIYGFHTRTNRKNESWDFTAGVNRIVNSQVILQEKKLTKDWLKKPEAESQIPSTADGTWHDRGIYGRVSGLAWFDNGDSAGTLANQWLKDGNDVPANGVKVAASYLNDEVTRLLDQWKKDHPGYTIEDFKAEQERVFTEYQAQHGVGSHIAETVITTVDKNGNYSIPFKGLYGVSAYKANSGLKVSHTITDEEFGKVVRDEDVDNSSLLKWNGTIGQKHRHINENYLYVSPVLSNYNIWSPAFPKAMFGNPSNLFTNVVAGSGTNITSLNFAILAPQPMLDIVDYDTTNKVAVSGNVTNSTVGGLLPTRKYQVQWFRDGVAIGEPQTIQSSVEGTATPEKFTVPNDITKTTNFTLGLFEQGQNTKSLNNALALDSFIAVFIEYKPVDGVVAKDSEPAKPIFKDKDGNDTTPPEGTKFTTVIGQVPDSVKTSYPEGAMSVDPNMVTIDPTTGVVVVKGEALTKKGTYVVPVEVTYPGGSKAYTFATVNVKDDATTTYTATGGKLEKPFGQAPSTDEITSKVTTDYPKEVKDQPTMKVKEGAVIPDGMTKGEFKVPVVVTYPDGSTDTVDVTVKVVDPRKDADKNEPKAKDQTVNIGETPKAEDSIENLKDLPAGTKVEFKTPIDTTTAGDKPGKVVVTYPDGSTDTVDVTVKVVDPRKDADKNEPKAKDQTVNIGETPKAEDSIENLKDLPAGTKVEFKTPIDTTTAGDKPGKVVVTYPDGSTDTVDVTVKVVDPRKDADKNEPKAKDQTVNIGETPKAEDSIENLKDLPAGTKVEFKTPIDTTTAGDKPGKVVVTYPDGSTDTVDVTVKVVDPRKDADKNEPKAKDQTQALSSIANNKDRGNKLPTTGEDENPFFNIAALTIIASVGLLSNLKKKED